MPQLKKQHIRQAILDAARRRFAEHGVKGSPLAGIAADAGTSIGNLYRYFSDKDALFEAAIPPTLAKELRALLREQVESLGTARDVTLLPEDHPYRRAAARTQEFSIQHRFELLFLLRHGDGTRPGSFRDDVAADLTRLAVRYAAQVHPELVFTPATRRGLRRIYQSYVGSLAEVLAQEQSPHGLTEATRTLSAYHLAGLRAFFTAATAGASSTKENV